MQVRLLSPSEFRDYAVRIADREKMKHLKQRYKQLCEFYEMNEDAKKKSFSLEDILRLIWTNPYKNVLASLYDAYKKVPRAWEQDLNKFDNVFFGLGRFGNLHSKKQLKYKYDCSEDDDFHLRSDIAPEQQFSSDVDLTSIVRARAAAAARGVSSKTKKSKSARKSHGGFFGRIGQYSSQRTRKSLTRAKADRQDVENKLTKEMGEVNDKQSEKLMKTTPAFGTPNVFTLFSGGELISDINCIDRADLIYGLISAKDHMCGVALVTETENSHHVLCCCAMKFGNRGSNDGLNQLMEVIEAKAEKAGKKYVFSDVYVTEKELFKKRQYESVDQIRSMPGAVLSGLGVSIFGVWASGGYLALPLIAGGLYGARAYQVRYLERMVKCFPRSEHKKLQSSMRRLSRVSSRRSTARRGTAQRSTAKHGTAQRSTAKHGTARRSTAQHGKAR